MTFFKIDDKEVSFENLGELFKTSRDVRNELFGKYLSEGEIIETDLKKKVEKRIKAYNVQLQNLTLLSEELQRVITAQNVEKMLNSVKDMSNEDAQALLEKLKAKLQQ